MEGKRAGSQSAGLGPVLPLCLLYAGKWLYPAAICRLGTALPPPEAVVKCGRAAQDTATHGQILMMFPHNQTNCCMTLDLSFPSRKVGQVRIEGLISDPTTLVSEPGETI